jgi:hypothetical protein
MDSEGSMPCPQKPATGTYPEPEEYNPRTHFRLGLPINFFFSGFLIKSFYAFLTQLIGIVGTYNLYFVMCSRQNIRECTHTYGDLNCRWKNKIKIRKDQINNKKGTLNMINNILTRKSNYQH